MTIKTHTNSGIEYSFLQSAYFTGKSGQGKTRSGTVYFKIYLYKKNGQPAEFKSHYLHKVISFEGASISFPLGASVTFTGAWDNTPDKKGHII